MGIHDLSGYLDDDGLDIPIDGRVYRVPSPDHTTGLRLTAMVNLGVSFAAGAKLDEKDVQRLDLDDDQEREFLPMVLGSAYAEMVAGGVSWVRIQRVGRYALLYFTLGPEAAADAAAGPQVAPGGAAGEAPAPNRKARRASSKESSATATSSTRSRGSSAGTTSRPSRRKAT